MSIGEKVDFFSSHILRALFWVNNAPQYEKTPNKEMVDFVDKYITCANDELSDDLKDLVNLEMHRHAKTCKKQGNKICRFNFPLPPIPRSMILYDGAHNDLQQLASFDENLILLKRKLDSCNQFQCKV